MNNEWNNFEGFSELSLAALLNDDMLAFFRENRFYYNSSKGKKEESLYNIEEYFKIRKAFLGWVKDKKIVDKINKTE